jgi:hypothetical protein
MIHPRHTRAVSAVVLAVLVVLSLPAGVGLATAQADDSDSDDSILSDLLGSGDSGDESGVRGAVDGLLGFVSGLVDRGSATITGPDRSVDDCRADLMAEINQHNASYITELNAKTSPSSDRDVLRVRCIEDPRRPWADSEAASFYVIGNVSSGWYESARAVESTDRAVDETIVLSGLARTQLVDDLAAYREGKIEGNGTVTQAYQQRMVAKYGGHVHGTLGPLPEIPEEYDDLDDSDGGGE